MAASDLNKLFKSGYIFMYFYVVKNRRVAQPIFYSIYLK